MLALIEIISLLLMRTVFGSGETVPQGTSRVTSDGPMVGGGLAGPTALISVCVTVFSFSRGVMLAASAPFDENSQGPAPSAGWMIVAPDFET